MPTAPASARMDVPANPWVAKASLAASRRAWRVGSAAWRVVRGILAPILRKRTIVSLA